MRDSRSPWSSSDEHATVSIEPFTGAMLGTVTIPGSKSATNRALILAAAADGVSTIKNVLKSDDSFWCVAALRQLGVEISADGDRVRGNGGLWSQPPEPLFIGSAGTTARFLTSVLALTAEAPIRVHATAQLSGRPMRPLFQALTELGGSFRYEAEQYHLPVEVDACGSTGASAVTIAAHKSSQYLSGLLMAAPLLNRPVEIRVESSVVQRNYVCITLNIMEHFGVQVEAAPDMTWFCVKPSRYIARDYTVEPDASTASYFFGLAAVTGGEIEVADIAIETLQPDIRFLEVLQRMGCLVNHGGHGIVVKGPGRLRGGFAIDMSEFSDTALTLAALAPFADAPIEITGIAHIRAHECDRIHAIVTELTKAGIAVEEREGGLRIQPGMPRRIRACTYDDHRMAMCFSLAAFGAEGIRINDPRCVAKTFPNFFTLFHDVVQAVPVIAIDGPSASGKGTVAQLVAERLAFHYLDSGALYRLLALAAQRDKVLLTDESGLAALAERMEIRFEGGKIWLDGALVGDELRGEQCAAVASRVAALPKVRAALLAKQHAFRRAPGLVADGRDMGSVVFPDAVLKIFLTASAEARAERRYKQLMEKGISANIASLLLDIRTRDERDTQRSVSPLQQALGASLLDTTALDIEQAVQEVLARYPVKGAKEPGPV